MRKPGLGRGLSALMDEVAAAVPRGTPASIEIARIVPSSTQPRRQFDPEALAELTESIRERGVLQPILVRPHGENRYEIVAGERRWRAAQAAGLHELPVVVRELDDRATFEIALVENIQRADLNAIEEAIGYRRLVDEFGHSLEGLAKAVGKSRSHISNLLRLLDLPEVVRQLVIDGRISMGHARALVGHPDAAALAQTAVDQGWSVRQMEAAVRKAAAPDTALRPASARSRSTARDANLVALEAAMADALGTRVVVTPGDGPNEGTVTIGYSMLDQLDMICQRLLGDTGRFA